MPQTGSRRPQCNRLPKRQSPVQPVGPDRDTWSLVCTFPMPTAPSTRPIYQEHDPTVTTTTTTTMKRNYPHRWVWWRTTRGFSSVVVVVVVVRCNVSLVLIVANGHDDDKTTFVVRLDTVYVEIQTQIPVLLPRQLQGSGAGQ